jgi:hypothetical protein
MDDNNGPRFHYLLPSLADVIFVVILVIIVSGLSKHDLLADGDTGFHIRAGEYIIENHEVPTRDIFSHTPPPGGWIAHEWLSEVIFALIHRATGLTGLVIVSSVIIALLFYLLMDFLMEKGVSIILASLLTSFAALISSIHWLARPHLSSLLLVLIFYRVIDRYESGKGNRLYLLPPLMLLWVNLHGGFMVGLLLLGVYVAGNSLSLLLDRKGGGYPNKNDAKRKIKALAITLGLCVIASAVNPQGFGILFFPLKLAQEKLLMDNVIEWQSPNFHYMMPFAYMLMLLIVIVGVSPLRLTATEAILLVLFTYMSLYSARHIPLFALITSPIIGTRAEDIVQKWKGNRYVMKFIEISENVSKTDSASRGHVWPAVAVAAVIVLAVMGSIKYQFDEEKFPVRAVEFLKQEKISGNMFNDDEFGDYIIYSAWPEYKVFFDGRSDMYGEERLKEYFDIIWLRPEMEEVFEKYDISWVIYKAESPLSAYLAERDDWDLIYEDEVAKIFIRNTPDNAGVTNGHPRAEPSPLSDGLLL